MACDYCKLTIPTINFEGCPQEGASGPEKAHYHNEGGGKICISERQLRSQDLSGLEETAIHEVIHHLGLMHGSSEEHAKFEQIKTYVRSRVWRPPDGVSFVGGGNTSAKQNENQAKSGSKRSTSKKKDSKDYESELRILLHQLEEARGKDERIRILDEIDTIRERLGSKFEIREGERKITDGLNPEDKEVVEKILTGNPYSDKEWETIINKIYEGQDYGFGDRYGTNRWNMEAEKQNKSKKLDIKENEQKESKEYVQSNGEDSLGHKSSNRKIGMGLCFLGLHKWDKFMGPQSAGSGKFKQKYICVKCKKVKVVTK